MSEPEGLRLLTGELDKTQRVLRRIDDFLFRYIQQSVRRSDRGVEQAMALSQALTNYYTCLETSFLRIARFFENAIEQDRWHQSLLQRMTVEVPGLRPSVISDESHAHLSELLKFRHFARYYFEFDYDWQKLDYVVARYQAVREQVQTELAAFSEFVMQLIAAASEDFDNNE